MKIITFAATSSVAPGEEFVARIRHSDGYHPVIFSAATEGAVRTKAQTWWDTELTKVDKRKGSRAPKKMEQAPS